MFASHKNSYLQLEPIVNPGIINRSVQAARPIPCIDEHDLKPPFNRLVSEQPPTPTDYVPGSLQPLGFERQAYAKLVDVLHNDCEIMSLMNTLNLMREMVRDPEKTVWAVRYDILDKLAQLLYNMNKSVRLTAFTVLITMANHGFCKDLIIKNHMIMDMIESSLTDSDVEFSLKALEMLEILSINYDIIDALLEMRFLKFLFARLLRDQDVVILAKLKILKNFLYCSGRCSSFELDALNSLLHLMDRGNRQIIVGALQCLMQILVTKTGRIEVLQKNILPVIVGKVYDEDRDVYTAATGALMNFTIKPKVKLGIYYKYSKIINRLMELSLRTDFTLQMYAMQTLLNLLDVNKIAKIIKKSSVMLKNIPVGNNQNLKEIKSRLVREIDATIIL